MNAENKKMGRPAETNPKNIKVTIRLTKNEKDKLDEYCQKNDIGISELLRKYILKVTK